MIGLNCLPTGFVQAGTDIASITMVAKQHALTSFTAIRRKYVVTSVIELLYAILS